MTTRLSLFESPLFLGFDQLEKTIDRIGKSASDSYPPYNIEQIDEAQFRISLAVAGFTIDDLDIVLEHNQLVIKGKIESNTEKDERIFLHRGIATRQFQRSFILSEDIEIEGAFLDHGLLHIDLVRIMPEISTKKIEIKNGQNLSKNDTINVKNKG